MRTRPFVALSAAAALAVSTMLTACSGGSSASGGQQGDVKGTTLTYWASNQGTSLQNDKDVLTPELAKFQQQTGVKVNVEVIGWNDLYTRILTATTSGQAPDVLNIGNTWASSLQATGAFMDFNDQAFSDIGGKDRFLATSLTTGGATGKAPTSVPLYGLAYGLYYNKKMFADAGLKPPTTWQELETAAAKLTDPAKKVYGLSLAAGSYTENAHFAFIFGKQHGADLFNGTKADFTSDGIVNGVQQYLDLMQKDKAVNPSNAQYNNGNQSVADFANHKAAMVLNQNNANATLAANGMKPDEYGVVAIPAPSPLPSGGKDVASHVAGINVSIFKDSKHQAAAKQFVKFLTSKDEQELLDKKFAALPVVKDAALTFTSNKQQAQIFQDVLATKSAPLPLVANEGDMETVVGKALNGLFAQIATGKSVSADDIKKALSDAQDKLASGG